MTSNILRSDYAGSEACRSCHAEIYERWSSSPMRRMTTNAGDVPVQAPFDGSVFQFMGDSARFEQHGGDRFMVLDSKYTRSVRYRVTRVIGGRHREDFVGIAVSDSAAEGDGAEGDVGEERILPVSWVTARNEFRYKGYSVLTPERPGLKPGSIWRQSCAFCHNTPHALATLYDDLAGQRFGYQGSTNESLLPRERQWELVVRNEDQLQHALAQEIELLSNRDPDADDTQTLLHTAAARTRTRYQPEHLMEIGIGCEACHGGSGQHVENPALLPSYLPESDLIMARPANRTRATEVGAINRSCRRCHSVLFSSYSFTWEGGFRTKNPGGSHINSGEARDFQLGGCVEQLSCTTCHDPHGRDAPARIEWLESPAGNAVCTHCHEQYSEAKALAAHTHHPGGSAGSVCIDCHMPKKNMALDYGLTRYHRIAAPTETVKVMKDRPLECALCHTDQSVGQLVDTMERWWGKHYDRAELKDRYPDLDQNAIVASLVHGKPHEQAVALASLDGAVHTAALSLATEQLENRYPLVRYYAREAIERVTGKRLEVNMSLPGAELRKRAMELLESSRTAKDDVAPRTTNGPAIP